MCDITVTFAHNFYRYPATGMIKHFHYCHEAVFYGSGCSGVTRIGGETYEFRENSVALIKRRSPHDEDHFSTGNVVFFGFDGWEDFTEGVYYDLPQLGKYFYDILSEIRGQPYDYDRMAALTAQKVLILIEREQKRGENSVKDLSYFKKHIEENFSQRISLRSLAASSGYSYDHFRHLFTRTYGVSPSQLIIRLKLECARKMLVSTELSCTEIALRCGFYDSVQMSKMVRDKYGAPPTELREKGRED